MDKILSVISASIAGITLAYVIIAGFTTWGESTLKDIKYKQSMIEKINKEEEKTNQLEAKIDETMNKLSLITKFPENSKVHLKFEEFGVYTSDLEERLKIIEELAGSNPEKILSVTMLKSEIENINVELSNMKNDLNDKVSDVGGRVDNIYLALFGATLSIVLFLIQHIFNKNKKTQPNI